jgi:probable addiction module antidote protein
MAVKTAPFDAAEMLDTEEAIEEFVAAAFETEDPAFIAWALGTVARARNMSRLAEEIGMSRPALYRAERKGQPGVRDHRQGHARAWAQAGPRQGNTSTGYQATAETGRLER